MRIYVVLSLVLLMSCAEKKSGIKQYSCPCSNAQYCGYLGEFRQFLYEAGYLSDASDSYCSLYSRLQSGEISIKLVDFWSGNFDLRARFVSDADSISNCYDSIFMKDPNGYRDSRKLIDFPFDRAVGNQLDSAVVYRVCSKARSDPRKEFAMVYLIFSLVR